MATGLLLLCCVACAAAAAHPPCEYQELPCESGQCVERDAWCDGPADCFDDSDEKYCRTLAPGQAKRNVNDCSESRYFQCPNGVCIPRVARCNDMPDCSGGEDEENCDYLYESSDPSEEANSATISTALKNSTTTADTTRFAVSTTSEAAPVTAPSKYLLPRGDTSLLPSRADVLQKSIGQLLSERDALWGWGRSTPRMVTALHLSNGSYFEKGNLDGLLTRKQLEVQLALDLMRQSERPLPPLELVHYVHALLSACLDPRDFYGVNVLRMLKRAMGRRRFFSPVALLALCNAGESAQPHLRRLKNMAHRRNDETRWRDVQSYALLAISCFSAQNGSGAEEWRALRRHVARNLSEWQQEDGGFGSLHSTGLALQALIAAEEPGTESAKGRALSHLLLEWRGVFGVDSYYVMPALNLQSLASLRRRKCGPRDTLGTEAERSRKQTLVHCSLWIGGEKNEIQTLTLAVPRRSNFVDVMEAAQKLNAHFKSEFLSVGKRRSVHAIAGRPSNVDRGLYWTLYRRVPLPFRPSLRNATATEARLRLLGAKRWTKDLHKLHPKDGESFAFWYKPYS